MQKERLRQAGIILKAALAHVTGKAFVLVIVSLFLLTNQLQAQNKFTQTKIDLELKDVRLKEAFLTVQKQSGINFVFSSDFNPYAARKVSVSGKGISVKTATERLLKNTTLRYTLVEDQVVIDEKPAIPQTDEPEKTGKGSVSGMVLDDAGEPLTGATITIAGTTLGTTADLNGQYTLKQVPAGTHTIEVRFISYQTQQVSDVQVTNSKTTRLDLVLKAASEAIDEVVVKADYKQASAEGLYARQQNAIKMVDGVSADLIKKTSDNNVAQVLKRVSGVTVENGKYVTVRGLSERYNNVQLNGSSVPSTEPNRRNFSFDIIPTALIDNITIAKTFTPDLPGEFTGGLVEVNTLAVPDSKLISINLGTGFNTISTGKDFRSTKRLDNDYLFGNSRDWYGNMWKSEISSNMFPTPSAPYSQLSDEQKKTLNEMDSRVPNYWGMRNYKGAPTQNYSVTVGMPFDLGHDNRLGVIASLTYRHEEKTDDLQRAYYLAANTDTLITGKQYKFITTTGAVLNVGWERPGHKITWRNLFNNRFTHTNTERVVFKESDIYTYQMEQYSSPQTNLLWQTQLAGEHRFPFGITLSWMTDYSKIVRSTPDDRFAVGNIMSDPQPSDGNYLINWIYPYKQQLATGFQMYSRLEESKKNIGINIEYPFIVAGNKQKLKAGYLGTFRNADFNREYLQTRQTSNETMLPDEEGIPLEEAYAQELYAEGKLYLRKAGLSNKDYYNGPQYIHAAYLMGDFTFWKQLHLTAGVRMEAGEMETTSQYRDNRRQTIVDTTLVNKKIDWLPAVTGIYNITSNLNLRAAYSKTIARPDFRELAITQYLNVEDRILVINSVGIKQSYTDNADLRLEWYPQSGEVISLSGFYKRFKNPVELLNLQSPQDQHYDRYTFNLKSATALGMELNIRKSFGFLAPESFLKNVYITANATMLKGDVKYNIWELIYESAGMDKPEDLELPEDRERPLQGLVPYAVNAGLDYTGKVFGAALNYGTTGRKLVQSGTYEMNDEYESPRDVLDLQLSARLLKGRMEVKANASDLLNQAYVVYRNSSVGGLEDLTDDMSYNKGKDWVIKQYKCGTTCSFSVSYNF